MKVETHPKFIKDIKKIKFKKTKDAVKTFILELQEAESLASVNGIKKLAGHPFAYRKRIGTDRVGFFLIENNTVLLVAFKKRNDIYKVFP
jgi:mRNA interferase RelE/StbE